MGIKNFDIKQVALVLAGNRITGFQDGDAIKIEPMGPAYQTEVGADGEGLRYKSYKADYYKLTVTLQYGSPAISFIYALFELDRLSGEAVVPVAVVSVNGGTEFGAGSCWVEQEPPVTMGEKPSPLEWVFMCKDAEHIHLPLSTAGI